ncbi:MAG TPA: hypothetical protein VJ927_06170 [Actinomycetota bacterium]|nr:hypothetical protein [Actinomycetota bacterium]
MLESGAGDALTRLPQRLGNLVELLTTLDTRVLSALDALENMQRSVAAFDPVGKQADVMMADAQRRIEAFDRRLNKDLDEIKELVMAKLGDLDLTGLDSRLDRLEASIQNIERATVSLDRSFEGGLELLPDFMTRKMKGEGKKKAPDPGTGPVKR